MTTDRAYKLKTIHNKRQYTVSYISVTWQKCYKRQTETEPINNVKAMVYIYV